MKNLMLVLFVAACSGVVSGNAMAMGKKQEPAPARTRMTVSGKLTEAYQRDRRAYRGGYFQAYLLVQPESPNQRPIKVLQTGVEKRDYEMMLNQIKALGVPDSAYAKRFQPDEQKKAEIILDCDARLLDEQLKRSMSYSAITINLNHECDIITINIGENKESRNGAFIPAVKESTRSPSAGRPLPTKR